MTMTRPINHKELRIRPYNHCPGCGECLTGQLETATPEPPFEVLGREMLNDLYQSGEGFDDMDFLERWTNRAGELGLLSKVKAAPGSDYHFFWVRNWIDNGDTDRKALAADGEIDGRADASEGGALDLLECPDCGSANVELDSSITRSATIEWESAWVECLDCDKLGPQASLNTRDDESWSDGDVARMAATAWNAIERQHHNE